MRTAILLALSLGTVTLAGAAFSAHATARLIQDQPAPEAGTRTPSEAERKGAIATIEAQLKAFKADDYTAALKYQSSGLKENFDDAEAFKKAIKRGYPQFARYKTVKFGKATCDPKGDRLAIQVTLTGEDNVTVEGVYLMLRENGEYRVDSVLGGTRPKFQPKDEV